MLEFGLSILNVVIWFVQEWIGNQTDIPKQGEISRFVWEGWGVRLLVIKWCVISVVPALGQHKGFPWKVSLEKAALRAGTWCTVGAAQSLDSPATKDVASPFQLCVLVVFHVFAFLGLFIWGHGQTSASCPSKPPRGGKKGKPWWHFSACWLSIQYFSIPSPFHKLPVWCSLNSDAPTPNVCAYPPDLQLVPWPTGENRRRRLGISSAFSLSPCHHSRWLKAYLFRFWLVALISCSNTRQLSWPPPDRQDWPFHLYNHCHTNQVRPVHEKQNKF